MDGRHDPGRGHQPSPFLSTSTDGAEIAASDYTSEGTIALLLNEDGQILLQLRDNIPTIPHPGTWGLLGGVREPGETSEECLRRELLEEIEFEAGPLTLVGRFITPRRHLLTLYAGRIDKRADDLTLHEGQAVRFFPKEALPDLNLAPSLRDVLLYYFFGTTPNA